MKPVQSTSERFVHVAQVIRQGEDEPELFCRFEMQIGQYSKRQLQFPVHGPVYLSSSGVNDQHPRSERPNLRINLL
jgi:hypothetical protein